MPGLLYSVGKTIARHPTATAVVPMGLLGASMFLGPKYEDLETIEHILDKNAQTQYLDQGLILRADGSVVDRLGNEVNLPKGQERLTFDERAAKYGLHSRDEVIAIQTALAELGLLKQKDIDGKFGLNTESAIKAAELRLGYDEKKVKTGQEIQDEEAEKYKKGNLWQRWNSGESEGLILDAFNGSEKYRKWAEEHPLLNMGATAGFYTGLYGGGFNKILTKGAQFGYKHLVPKTILSKLISKPLQAAERAATKNALGKFLTKNAQGKYTGEAGKIYQKVFQKNVTKKGVKEAEKLAEQAVRKESKLFVKGAKSLTKEAKTAFTMLKGKAVKDGMKQGLKVAAEQGLKGTAAKQVAKLVGKQAAKKAMIKGAVKIGLGTAAKLGAKAIPFVGGAVALADAGHDIYRLYKDWDTLSTWGKVGYGADALMNGIWAVGSFMGLKHGGKFNKREIINNNKKLVYYVE